MRNLSIILFVLLSAACGGDNGQAGKSQTKGTLKGVIDNKAINVAVNCGYFNTNDFTFYTEVSQTSNSDVAGIKINGYQIGDDLNLEIATSDAHYTAPSLTQFNKTATKANGKGFAYNEEGTAEIVVEFTLNCQ